MVKDDHNTGKPARKFGLKTTLTAVVMAALLSSGGAWLLLNSLDGGREASAQSQTPQGPMLFRDWPKPDFTLLLSGQQHGYMLPCGCSRPQIGGLERRYNFLKSLQQRDWSVLPLDLGDVPQTKGPRDLPNVQGMSKYLWSIRALDTMGYGGVGLGEFESSLVLEEALAKAGNLGLKVPLLAGNLSREKSLVFKNETAPFHIATVPGTKLKVAVVSVVSPDVASKIHDKNVTFDSVKTALQGVSGDAAKPGLLKEMQQSGKVDLQVLLYHGAPEKAKLLAAAFPNFNVILCVSEEDEPPAAADKAGNTMLVTVGHKGKNIGVVGCFAKGNTYELRYQMVRLGEEYMTPEKDEKEHPVMKLMEAYAKELKDEKVLSLYPQVDHPLQAEARNAKLNIPMFVGSEACMKCHEEAFKVWKDSGHAHAYQTLVDAKKPSLRQYDGECIVCHTVGFGYTGGFTGLDVKDAKLLEKQHKLKDVGCESCHGPASEHVKNSNNPDWYKKLNPWKVDAARAKKDPTWEKRRVLQIDQMCQKCHDTDNDVNWVYNVKWPKVEHHTPAP